MKNEVELPFGDDAENRLTRVQNQGYDTISESYYDALGRRVRKVVTNSDNDGDYRYLWNQDWQLMNVFVFADSELKPRQRLVHAGSPTAWYKSPSPFKGEGWGEGVGGGRAYIDDHVCIYIPGGMGGGRKYFHTDAQYNTQMVTDASSNSVASYVLSAYGLVETVTQPGMGGLGSYATNNAMIHQGLIYDAETGSYYNRHRVYLPGLGRFAQRDPLGDSASKGLLEYCLSNPPSYMDPDGFESFRQIISEFDKVKRNLDKAWHNSNPNNAPIENGFWLRFINGRMIINIVSGRGLDYPHVRLGNPPRGTVGGAHTHPADNSDQGPSQQDENSANQLDEPGVVLIRDPGSRKGYRLVFFGPHVDDQIPCEQVFGPPASGSHYEVDDSGHCLSAIGDS